MLLRRSVAAGLHAAPLAWRIRPLVRPGGGDPRRVLGHRCVHVPRRRGLGVPLPRQHAVRCTTRPSSGRGARPRRVRHDHRIRHQAGCRRPRRRVCPQHARVPDPRLGRQRAGGGARDPARCDPHIVDPPRDQDSDRVELAEEHRDSRCPVRSPSSCARTSTIRSSAPSSRSLSTSRSSHPSQCHISAVLSERWEPVRPQIRPDDRAPAAPARRAPLQPADPVDDVPAAGPDHRQRPDVVANRPRASLLYRTRAHRPGAGRSRGRRATAARRTPAAVLRAPLLGGLVGASAVNLTIAYLAGATSPISCRSSSGGADQDPASVPMGQRAPAGGASSSSRSPCSPCSRCGSTSDSPSCTRARWVHGDPGTHRTSSNSSTGCSTASPAARHRTSAMPRAPGQRRAEPSASSARAWAYWSNGEGLGRTRPNYATGLQRHRVASTPHPMSVSRSSLQPKARRVTGARVARTLPNYRYCSVSSRAEPSRIRRRSATLRPRKRYDVDVVLDPRRGVGDARQAPVYSFTDLGLSSEQKVALLEAGPGRGRALPCPVRPRLHSAETSCVAPTSAPGVPR